MKKEKEKMLAGEKYFPNNEELTNERIRAKELCFRYNSIPNSREHERMQVLKELLGRCDDSTRIESNFFCDYGYNISVGKSVYVNHNCVILDCASVTFGNNVLIGPNCGFYTASHPISAEERASFAETAEPIKVGNDVWFGGNVVVLPGVTIGSNVAIGAGSVVTKDIPSNVAACGNPCKVVKNIDD